MKKQAHDFYKFWKILSKYLFYFLNLEMKYKIINFRLSFNFYF